MNILIEKTYAQFTNLVPITTTARTGSIEALMTTVVGWISLIVGILAFIYLIYSGILYITAAGNPDQAKKGQQGIMNAIIGVIICIMAYTIVLTVARKASGDTSTIPPCTQTEATVAAAGGVCGLCIAQPASPTFVCK